MGSARIAPGPNGRLYLGAGAEQDALAGGHVTSGTVVSFKGDGSDLRIEAKGLRGPFGLAFIPGTASLLVTDNGRDDLGVHRPPDELNLVRDVTRAAPDFGFPDCYDQGGRACAATAAPLALLPAHAGVGGVAVTRDWGGRGLTAFVAENGSILPGVDAGREVRRIELRRRPGGGYDASGSVFATGFGEQDALGTAIGPGGALYVTLFGDRRRRALLPGLRPLNSCDFCRSAQAASALAAIQPAPCARTASSTSTGPRWSACRRTSRTRCVPASCMTAARDRR